MDHSRNLIELLQRAELKAKMSLYYLKEDVHTDEFVKKEQEIFTKHGDISEVDDLYASSQMYCRNLEKQLKDKNEEMKKNQIRWEEVERHNEAMLEEISLLNNKLEMYPKTIRDLKSEIDKLSQKVTMLEEQKKYMEQQAAQNEARLQQSHTIQQDLVHSQAYIARLQKHIDSSGYRECETSSLPVLLLDKNVQTSTTSFITNDKVQSVMRDHSKTITQLRADLSALRESCAGLNSFNDDVVKLREIVQSREFGSNHVTTADGGTGNHRNGAVQSPPTPIEFLLNVERVEVLGRVLPPSNDQTLATHTNNTNNTNLIVNDNNTIATYTLDLVIPINASQQQLMRLVSRTCHRLTEGRSVLIVMLGDSDLTLYGTSDSHGLIHHLVKSLTSMKGRDEVVTVSVGTFVKNQMCDGLSEFSKSDGKVTALPFNTFEQGIELLSHADIPDDCDQVLHQFTFRSDDTSTGSVSILECQTVDSESSDILQQYRCNGRVVPGSRPNVLYDTVHAYTEKGGAVTVFLNLKPDISSTNVNQGLLKHAAQITGFEPVVQTKKRGIFSFK